MATLFGSLTESCLSALDYFPDKVSQNQQMRRTSKGDDNKHENHNDDDNFNKNDDDQALQGAFFIFSNVCTRLEGRFRLRFILNDLTR